jgi:endonuclease V-like protein UPF0215 family
MSQNAFRNKRVVGVEDGSFQKGITQRALLVVVLFKGLRMESVKTTRIRVDGLDATEKLGEILGKWKFDAVFLAGVSFAGFNIIDPAIIHAEFGNPVIIISRTKPNNEAVKRALERHFGDWKSRWRVFHKLGLVYEVALSASEPPVYFETLGVSAGWAVKLLRAFSVCSRIPEPVRVARLIARGLS